MRGIFKSQHISLFWVLLLLLSCKKTGMDAHAYFNHDKNSDTLLSKRVILPEQLIQLSSDEHYSVDSFSVQLTGKKSMISIIDGTCMACIIDQLNALDSLFNTIREG